MAIRDLKDASLPRLSPGRPLGIAYNAGLQLATLALVAEGYSTEGPLGPFSPHSTKRRLTAEGVSPPR